MGAVVLVLGGTGFVGRTLVEHLLADGHEPVLFNRGRDDLFPGVPRLIGDRETGDYAALRNAGPWDAVVDVTGYYPRDVGRAMDAIGDGAGRYVFISSHAVFDGAGPGLRAPIRDAGPPLTNETYGPSKLACEQDVTARYAERATIVRPCKVAGPYDNQTGLADWLRMAERGGRVELPGDPAQPIQLVDCRDVARLLVDLLVTGRGGTFTAAGPSTTLGEVIRMCAEAAGTTLEVVRVPPVERLFPLVRPPEQWNRQHRTPAPEMTVTPLEVTIRDTLAWLRS